MGRSEQRGSQSAMKTRAAFWTAAILMLGAARSPAGDWPNWRGPDRNGVSDETGLVTVWSVSGLNVAWRNEFVARATPIVMDGRVCTSGRDGQGPTRQEAVACWDAATGKLLWQCRFNGSNTTVPCARVGWAALAGDPETGNVYAQNVDGQLVAMDRTGKTVWEHRLGEEYGRGSGFGGRTLIPVVDDDLVIV